MLNLIQILINTLGSRYGYFIIRTVWPRYPYKGVSLSVFINGFSLSISLVIRTIKDVRINLVRIINQAVGVSLSVD